MKQLLDEISAIRINPNAYEEWGDYRKKLTDIVIAGTSRGDTLAVYGAGSCNDIDLGRFAEHFSEITLLDINEEAMKSAVRRYGLDGFPKVRTEFFDFVGISEEDYERIAGRMNEVLDLTEAPITEEKLVMKLRPAIETFYGALERNLFRAPRYDAVLAAGLHSQLNQTAVSIWRNLCDRRGIETDPLHDPVSSLFHERTYPIIVRSPVSSFMTERARSI